MAHAIRSPDPHRLEPDPTFDYGTATHIGAGIQTPESSAKIDLDEGNKFVSDPEKLKRLADATGTGQHAAEGKGTDRWAQQTIQPGEKRVEAKDESRVPNAANFKFMKEGHTLGNLLRSALVEHPHVIFAAYVIPHPMIPEMTVRVQTDGVITPKQAIIECCDKGVRDLEQFRVNFNREYEIAKAVKASQGIDITKPSSSRTFRTGAFAEGGPGGQGM